MSIGLPAWMVSALRALSLSFAMTVCGVDGALLIFFALIALDLLRTAMFGDLP